MYVFLTGTTYCATEQGEARRLRVSSLLQLVMVGVGGWTNWFRYIILISKTGSSTSLSVGVIEAEAWASEMWAGCARYSGILVHFHTPPITIQFIFIIFIKFSPFHKSPIMISIHSKGKKIRNMLKTKPKHDQERNMNPWTNQMQIKTPDWARTVNFYCYKILQRIRFF